MDWKSRLERGFGKYKFGFDAYGLLLFLLIMLPNFIWFAVPAPNDVLRADSVTPVIDGIGSVCQVIFAAALCAVVRADTDKIRISPLLLLTGLAVSIYFGGWIFYYTGIAGTAVILTLTVSPCIAFMLYAADRRNMIAMIPMLFFTCCHLVYGAVNFII